RAPHLPETQPNRASIQERVGSGLPQCLQVLPGGAGRMGAMAIEVAPPETRSERWAMFAPLRYRNYRLFWLGQFPSVTAQNMQHVAVAWLVFQLTNSPALLGIAGLAQALPNIAFSFVGGAMADRMDRKRLLLLTQGITAVLFFALGTLVAADLVQYWHVLVVAFLLGTVRSFDQPARQALLPLM